MHGTLVVIIAYNARRYTIECIESVRKKLTPGTYKIVVVDNASTDGIREWLSWQSDILLIKSDTNIGFGPACNLAVRSTLGTEYENYDVFLLNSDTVMTSIALPRIISALYEKEDIGAVGAMANYAGNRQQLDVEFSSVEEYISFGENLQVPISDSRMEKVRLNGFAMLVKRNVWDQIGGFDEDFAPGYYEDDALSIEILKLGYRLVLARDAFIYHAGSASFVKTGKNTLSIEHHQLFIEKYGFDILNYVYPSGAVISQIPFGRQDSFNVLHLGCGLGAELKAIRSLFPNAQVYGIEPDSLLRDISSRTEQVFSDIKELSDKTGSSFFDLLITDSNYLEHLSDDDKNLIVSVCAPKACEIERLHEYDEFPFDNVKLILWAKEDYNPMAADLLAGYGIMSSIYSNDKLKDRVNSYGIYPDNILLITSDRFFKINAMIMCPALMTAGCSIIPYLTAHFGRLKQTDPSHKNSDALRIFEKKTALSKNVSSKEEFLKESKISVTINKDCLSRINDICALQKESFLLDYTKTEYDTPHLSRLVTNSWNDCGYITAKDKYDDYGIVGFYCYDQRSSRMLCFSFSWKVTGMSIEQYVYNKLGAPIVDPKAPVYSTLTPGFETPWIFEDSQSAVITDRARNSRINLLLKGDSSLKPIEDYLVGGNVTSEYDDGTAQLPTKLYTDPFHIIIYSLLQQHYDSWESDGDAKLTELLENLEKLCDYTLGDPTILLLLGPEKEFGSETTQDKQMISLYRELNPIINDFASDHPQIKTINVTDFIDTPSDYNGSARSFSVKVYSDIVEQIVIHINEKIDSLTK